VRSRLDDATEGGDLPVARERPSARAQGLSSQSHWRGGFADAGACCEQDEVVSAGITGDLGRDLEQAAALGVGGPRTGSGAAEETVWWRTCGQEPAKASADEDEARSMLGMIGAGHRVGAAWIGAARGVNCATAAAGLGVNIHKRYRLSVQHAFSIRLQPSVRRLPRIHLPRTLIGASIAEFASAAAPFRARRA
jgi:hypothetical protein